MRFPARMALGVVVTLVCLQLAVRSAGAADFILADFENIGTGTGGLGTDFDTFPTDQVPACSGCWYEGAGQQTFTAITQSTIGATHGTKSMKVDFAGKGAGGGDGLSDTHFATPVRVTWSSTVTPIDPRFVALRNAANGNQGLFTIDFDLTYDIPALRALNWLGPPVDFPAKPEKFIGMGIYKTSNNDGGPYTHAALEQVLPTLINPFDPAYNGLTYLTVHSSVPFTDFQFTANPVTAPTFYELGFSMNGNWGTNPASSNTQAASFYIDNIVLKEFNPIAPIDFNNNGLADEGDWGLFMAQYLKAAPPALVLNPNISFDLVGEYGSAQVINGSMLNKFNNEVDFSDLQEFQRLYEVAQSLGSGGGGLAGSVPEPASLALIGLGVVSSSMVRRRRSSSKCR